MHKNNGITLIILVIIIVVMLILVGISWKYGGKTILLAELQDVKANMMLIQAKTKTTAEKVNFEDNDNAIPSEIKVKKVSLKDTESFSDDEKFVTQKMLSENQITDEFYLLNQDILNKIGLSNIKLKNLQYYFVDYNLHNPEIVYSKGFEYEEEIMYKLSDIDRITIQ